MMGEAQNFDLISNGSGRYGPQGSKLVKIAAADGTVKCGHQI